MRDGGDVKAFGIGAFGDPTTLSRVIGNVEGLDQDLIFFQRRKRGSVEGESLIGTREFRESGRLVGQDPLTGFGWGGHCGLLEGLSKLLEATCGHICSRDEGE